ncbi:9600_t:CDS:2 [Scutellospora calospora]|uniref:9600_t:CDS:1 n=1 Tax=Scutellospora calospora TaxID=85575 RepID=A0ACA9MP45_9GLOM|nr:9600_t:CDS:2 [Scutellospora calospora]
MKKVPSTKAATVKEQNVRWMLNSHDPSPLAFFRFSFPMHRARAFEIYGKVLESALDQCQDENVKGRLLRTKGKFNAELQRDWELWLEERKATNVHVYVVQILVNRSIQNTNIVVQNRFNTRVENQGTLSTTPTIINNSAIDIGDSDENDVENLEDKRELLMSSIVNSPITTDANEEEVLESLAFLFESSQEDLISSIAEESLDREETVIPNDNKLVLSSQLDVFAHFRNIRFKIPSKNKILNPAYYGIIDLTGQYIETKRSFDIEDWEELRNLFGIIVQWQSIRTPKHFAKYFDENFTLPPNPEDELKTFHTAVEFL